MLDCGRTPEREGGAYEEGGAQGGRSGRGHRGRGRGLSDRRGWVLRVGAWPRQEGVVPMAGQGVTSVPGGQEGLESEQGSPWASKGQRGSPVSPGGSPAQARTHPHQRNRPGPRRQGGSGHRHPGGPAGPAHEGTRGAWGWQGAGLGSLGGPRSSLQRMAGLRSR